MQLKNRDLYNLFDYNEYFPDDNFIRKDVEEQWEESWSQKNLSFTIWFILAFSKGCGLHYEGIGRFHFQSYVAR